MEFLQFVPYNVEFQDIWEAAFKLWKANLSAILNMEDKAFIIATNTSSSFVNFIHQVWDAYLDGERVDSTLLRYLLLVYVRLSRLPSTENHCLFQTDLLVKLAVVYSSTNKLQVREIIQDFAENLTSILHTLVESIESLSQATLDRDVLERAYVLARTFDALVSATLPEFLPLDTLITDWYRDLVPCLKALVDSDRELAPYAYTIKRCFVSAFQSAADLYFFRPLGYTVSDQLVVIGEPINKDKAIEFLAQWIEKNEIKPSSAFVDAPLIMDWELAYAISDKISQINSSRFAGEDEMLQILQLQMEQVRDTIEQREDWRPQNNDDDREQKIAQVRDVLGNLSDDMIETYLDANNNDPEAVIIQLLQERDVPTQVLSSRKNIYDNDEFDVFSHNKIDTSKIYLGKKDKANADSLLDDKSFIDKDSMMQRVIDMYEDEYDDTYDDINDAAGVATVGQEDAQDIVKQKATHLDPGIQHESLLVHLFMENPDILARNSTTRKSPKRIELRKQTGMTDEQLEGWAIMFSRNVSYMIKGGNQSYTYTYLFNNSQESSVYWINTCYLMESKMKYPKNHKHHRHHRHHNNHSHLKSLLPKTIHIKKKIRHDLAITIERQCEIERLIRQDHLLLRTCCFVNKYLFLCGNSNTNRSPIRFFLLYIFRTFFYQLFYPFTFF